MGAIADGEMPIEPLITKTVRLDGLRGAIDELAQPDEVCKILVVP